MKCGRKQFTDNFLLKKLKEAAVILGRTPGQRDLERLSNFPSRGAYRNHFGSVEKAKAILGLPPAPKGMNHPNIRAGLQHNHKPKKKTLKLRFQVLHRDNFTCQYCGQTPQHGIKLEVDHILPTSKGGETILDNLITSCYSCNRGKQALILNNHPKKIPQRVKTKRLSEAFNNNQLSWLNA